MTIPILTVVAPGAVSILPIGVLRALLGRRGPVRRLSGLGRNGDRLGAVVNRARGEQVILRRVAEQLGIAPFGIHTSAAGRFSTVGGGVNVEVDGELVGAIGLSGGAPEQDIACAEAGIAHFLKTRGA